MKLYQNPASANARRARITAYHLALPVEEVLLDFLKGEHKAPEYLALNPNGALPTLVDGDVVLTESRVIMQYLADLKPESGLLPADRNARYEVIRWQFWDACHFSPAVGTVVFQKMLKPVFYGGQADPERVKEGLENFRRFGAVLDQRLAGKDFVVGNALTLADLTLATSLTHAAAVEVPIAEFPNVARWFAEMQKLDAWQRSLPG